MPQTLICRITKKSFGISDKEIAFCERLNMPLPTLSPEERLRLLLATRNEWKLYRRKCDATGKEIISVYPPDSGFKVYNNETWWEDSWNALEYGRDFDFSHGFFEQFAELQKAVPREGTSIFNCENCDYNLHIRQSRNCFLNSLVAKCEDIHYSYWMSNDKDVIDCDYTNDSTLCYWCTDVNNCYNCVVLQESNDCNDCFFSYQLRGCHNCIFCNNLINKEFHVFNKPVGKGEFEMMKTKILDGSASSWHEAYQDFLKLRKEAIHQGVHTLKCENCTGDHIYNCKSCANCFDSFESEDCFNSISLSDSKDVYNAYSAGWQRCEVVYNCCVSRTSTNIAFCTYTWFSANLRYCDSCVSCQDCFGCIGLRHKQYCILNKQYDKPSFDRLKMTIIEHMKKTGEYGEFFPPALSPYAYNETAADEFFPLAKEEAQKRGWRWREEEISSIKDNITNEILACAQCGKNYKIIPQELKFYRNIRLPLPRECPSCRHAERMALRNLPHLWGRKCSKCGNTIKTTYAPERPETIYCEQCYLQTIY